MYQCATEIPALAGVAVRAKVDEASGRQGEGETRGMSERESKKNVALAALLSVD